MRASTRVCKRRYSSISAVGQKLIMRTESLWLPMRSMRPKRWMMRIGFQWMS